MEIKGEKFKNKKNRNIYWAFWTDIKNATNAQDGQQMILYSDESGENFYVREKSEFYEKFEGVDKKCLI